MSLSALEGAWGLTLSAGDGAVQVTRVLWLFSYEEFSACYGRKSVDLRGLMLRGMSRSTPGQKRSAEECEDIGYSEAADSEQGSRRSKAACGRIGSGFLPVDFSGICPLVTATGASAPRTARLAGFFRQAVSRRGTAGLCVQVAAANEGVREVSGDRQHRRGNEHVQNNSIAVFDRRGM